MPAHRPRIAAATSGWVAVVCTWLVATACPGAARADEPVPPVPTAPPALMLTPPAPALAPIQAPSAAPAPVPPARKRYFYQGYDYGSQSLYSPLWVFLNRGYDVLQDHVASRNVFGQHFRANTGNVLDNLAHPISAISADGWKNFFTQEIFPLSYGSMTARWTPNYSLHLIGGGTTYTALTEWFQDRDVPLARVWSAATLMASALVNESIENKGVMGTNTDAIADIYFFDIGGIILFSFDFPNWFFSHVVVIDDWSLQPSFTLPRGDLHDQGNYFAAKWSLPFYPRLRLFTYFGEATMFGASFRLDDEYSLSGGYGLTATRLINDSTKRAANYLSFAKTGGAFLDRRESLLASLQISDVSDYFVTLNVYPHAFWQRGPAMGAWTVVDKHAHVALGVSISRLLGVGAGWSSL